MEDSIVAAHLALLIGCLIENNIVSRLLFFILGGWVTGLLSFIDSP